MKWRLQEPVVIHREYYVGAADNIAAFRYPEFPQQQSKLLQQALVMQLHGADMAAIQCKQCGQQPANCLGSALLELVDPSPHCGVVRWAIA